MVVQKRPDRVGNNRTAFEKNRQIILKTQEVCGICGAPVDKTLRSPHPLSPTVDHIIPVSKGGHPSALENLQLAHRICNRAKADKLIVEEFKSKNKDLETKKWSDKRAGLPQHFDWINYQAPAEQSQ